jgi:glycosyltransferase involved in cell wall biosynthesis
MAMGKAIVSTALGAEGIAVTDGADILLADTAVDFADLVSRVLGDAALARRLGAAARRLIESRYSWRSAIERLESFYQQLPDPVGISPASRPAQTGTAQGG